MGIRVLFLKLVDLLLFSMLVKSKTGIDELEDQPGFAISPPSGYIWIYLLNQKLGITPTDEQQKAIVRAHFWLWQIIWALKRYYKEKSNRNRSLSFTQIISAPIVWIRSEIDKGDVKGKTYLYVYKFMRLYEKEIRISSLSEEDKKFLLKQTQVSIKTVYLVSRPLFKGGFREKGIEDHLMHYGPIYELISDQLLTIYFLFLGIPPTDMRWKNASDFSKKLFLLAVAQNDISDFRGIINADGKLNEPNIFACFLTTEERIQIGKRFPIKNQYTSIETAKKEYPRAFRKFHLFVKDQLRQIDLIPGTNLHELLEFYFFHFPQYYMTHIAVDYPKKKEHRMEELQNLALYEKNKLLIEHFHKEVELEKHMDKQTFTKKYLDLVSYLFAQQLHQSGASLQTITTHLNQSPTTISHWLHDDRVPLSLRTRKIKKTCESSLVYYLLGFFLLKGTVSRGSIKISSNKKAVLDLLNKRISPQRDLIHTTKAGYYLRYYNTSLAQQLLSLNKDLIHTMTKSSIQEQKSFVEGLFDSVFGTDSLLRINKSNGQAFVDWLVEYLLQMGKEVRVSEKGNYYILDLRNGKSRLVKAQDSTPWGKVRLGDGEATRNLVEQYQQYGKALIRQYFGNQQSEFWAELPSIMYICIREGIDAYLKKQTVEEGLRPFLKYHILTYFRNYFKTIGKEYATSSVDEELEDTGAEEKVVNGIDTQIMQKSLKRLEKADIRAYYAVALRYGYIDSKEHTLTEDLPQRLSELSITDDNGNPLSKTQTYHLLQKGIEKIKSLTS